MFIQKLILYLFVCVPLRVHACTCNLRHCVEIRGQLEVNYFSPSTVWVLGLSHLSSTTEYVLNHKD